MAKATRTKATRAKAKAKANRQEPLLPDTWILDGYNLLLLGDDSTSAALTRLRALGTDNEREPDLVIVASHNTLPLGSSK